MVAKKRTVVSAGGGRPGRGLSRDRILQAAMSLVDQEGEQGLSMRRLGSSLGVEAMAIYNHFENREAILDAMADWLFSQMSPPGAGAGWRSMVRGLAMEFRGLALRHPNRFGVAMSRPSKPARALPLMDVVLGALAQGGMSPARRVQVYHALVGFIRGFLLWEMDIRAGRCSLELPREMLAEFPHVKAAAARMGLSDLDRLFAGGVDVILEGGLR